MFSYFLNGPLTLLVVLLGSLLNACTIYVLSIYTLSRSKSQKRKLANIAAILRANESIRRKKHKDEGEATFDGSPRPNRNNNPHLTCNGGGKSNQEIGAHTPHSAQAQPSQRPRIYTFLLWLSVSDTCVLISALLMYGTGTVSRGRLSFVQCTSIFYLMSNAALTASVWLMCALIADRYRTISRSFKRSSQSTSGINKTLSAVCVCAVIFSLPRFFEIEVVFDEESQDYYPVQTELVHSKLYMVGYRIVGAFLITSS